MSSYSKGSNETTAHSSKPRKRTSDGNQFSDDRGQPIGESASARELSTPSVTDNNANTLHCYKIIDFVTVFTALSTMLICAECEQNVKFEESGSHGLGFKIVVLCRCNPRVISSSPTINNDYEINRRIVFVMRLLGIGRDGINLFCGLMDICGGLSAQAYTHIMKHIYTSTRIMFNIFCKKAGEEEKKKNEKHERNLHFFDVSGEGSWKKRGYSSLFGVTTLIGYYSGKIIDLIVKSSYCKLCAEWKDKENYPEYIEWFREHEKECAANHEDSADKMEVDAVVEMFLRSEEKFQIKYKEYIGNGDSKIFKAIDEHPYGDNFYLEKSECIEHAQKRMDTRLRILRDAQKLDGKDKLTEKLIKKLCTCYGLAIRRNAYSVKKMRESIMATYYHLCSTNKNPRHEYCPRGEVSWCKWQVAQATGVSYNHPPPLHVDLQKHLLPIYGDLSESELLERCWGDYIQIPNEGFNSTVWRLAPKHQHSGAKIIQICAYIAAGLFNEGFSAILGIMQNLEIKMGQQCLNFANTYEERLRRQERRGFNATKEARQARRQLEMDQNEFFEESEGLFCGPGIAGSSCK